MIASVLVHMYSYLAIRVIASILKKYFNISPELRRISQRKNVDDPCRRRWCIHPFRDGKTLQVLNGIARRS